MKNSEKIIFFGKTDVGRQRSNNEDAFVAELLDENTVLAVVIDGVGGYEGGEVAAEIAQREIPSYLKEFNRGERLELLKQAVVFANNAIFDCGRNDMVRAHMECVLTSAVIDTNRKVIDMVHVGDTRLYQFHHGALRKLSHDHSYVGYCEENGELTEEEAMHHPRRNEISRAVGEGQHEVSDCGFLESEEFPLLPNSTFLLCSDGLTDLITSMQIVAILEQPLSLEEKVQVLIDAANEAGGKDNVTVVLVEYQAEEDGVQLQEEPITQTNEQEEETWNSDDAHSDTQCRKDRRLRRVVFFILLLLLFYAIGRSLYIDNRQEFDIEKPQPYIDTIRCNNGDVKEFTFMYDIDTDHPWSSYMSTDSNYVLRLEKVYEDSLGSTYRAIIYEPEYWYKGKTYFPKFGEEPTYVGYGTDYYEGYKDCYLEFSFIRGDIGPSGDAYAFVLSGSYRDWDSVLTSNPVPAPWLSVEDDYEITFKKRDWMEIREWWDRKQARCLEK